MKTSGVSCEPKFGLLGFLGHPNHHYHPNILLSSEAILTSLEDTWRSPMWTHWTWPSSGSSGAVGPSLLSPMEGSGCFAWLKFSLFTVKKKVTEKWKWDNKYDDIFSMVTAKTSSSEMHPLFLSFSGQTCGVLWLLKSVIFQTLSLWLHLSDHWNYVSFLLPPKHQSCSYKSFWRWKNYTLKTRFVYK